jgi:hypothetical protein
MIMANGTVVIGTADGLASTLAKRKARNRTTAYRGSARLARRAWVLLGLAVGRLVVGRQNMMAMT